MTAAEPRPACTIILCCPDPAGGFSVFMVQRHGKSGFLPNAWVFPGGRVDPGDHLAGHERIVGGQQAIQHMGLGPHEGTAFLVAGVRETLEESGIWLGTGEVEPDTRDALNNNEIDFAAVLDRHDATVDLDALGVWSWWVTPRAEPRRYNTRFLVAVVDSRHGRHDEHETIDSRWVDPRAVLEGWSQKRFPMAPPTWFVLHELAQHQDAGAVLAACAQRYREPIEPVLEYTDAFHLYLPGHDMHDAPAIDGVPAYIGFDGERWFSR